MAHEELDKILWNIYPDIGTPESKQLWLKSMQKAKIDILDYIKKQQLSEKEMAQLIAQYWFISVHLGPKEAGEAIYTEQRKRWEKK